MDGDFGLGLGTDMASEEALQIHALIQARHLIGIAIEG
jgi:hypothetical protein